MSSEKTPLLLALKANDKIKDDDERRENQSSFEPTPPTTWPSYQYHGYQTTDFSGGSTVKRNLKYGDGSSGTHFNIIVSNYDQILVHIGDIGWWQMLIVALLCLPSIAGGILVLLTNFTALEPQAFRCAISECDGTYAKYTDLNVSSILHVASTLKTDSLGKDIENSGDELFCMKPIISYDENGNDLNVSAKVKSVRNQEEIKGNCSFLSFDDITNFEACNVVDPNQVVLYQSFEYSSTIVTDFNLVCDEQYKVALCGTFYMVGLLIGAFLGSKPADYFGRKPVLFLFLILGGLSNIAGGLVSNYWLYVLFRALAGIAAQGI